MSSVEMIKTRSLVDDDRIKLSFEDQVLELKEERRKLEETHSYQITEATEKGFESGYSDGFKKGVQDGIERSMETGKNSLDKINVLIGEIKNKLQEKSDDLTRLVADSIGIAFSSSHTLACKIDSEYVLKIVEASLDAVPFYAKTITIQCSASDYDIIKKHNQGIKITMGEYLNEGEVVVDTDVNIIKVTNEELAKKVVDSIISSNNAIGS